MKRSEVNKIMKSNNITHYYIYKGSYYRPNSSGYTDYKPNAGIYTKEDALRHYNGCSELTLIPINKEQHNEMIIDKVNDLLTRYIK